MIREIMDRILFIEYIYQYKIIICKEFNSVSLIMIKNFDNHKDFEVFMIEIYLNKIFDIFEIMISVFHEFNDNKHFSIMNIIIIFDKNIFS